MLPFKTICIMENIFSLHRTENIRCTKRKIYTAQNGKYTLYKTENIPCTKEEIRSLHKRENICCTKQKIYAAQKRIYVTQKRIYVAEKRIYVAQKRIQITENRKWNTLPGFYMKQLIRIMTDHCQADASVTYFLIFALGENIQYQHNSSSGISIFVQGIHHTSHQSIGILNFPF